MLPNYLHHSHVVAFDKDAATTIETSSLIVTWVENFTQ